jgi:hypothetical protein
MHRTGDRQRQAGLGSSRRCHPWCGMACVMIAQGVLMAACAQPGEPQASCATIMMHDGLLMHQTLIQHDDDGRAQAAGGL